MSPFKYFSYIEQIIDIPSKTDIHRLYTLCKFGCLISSNRFNMFVAENTKHWPRQCQTLWITQNCLLIHYYRLWHLQCKNVSHVNWITQITKHAITLLWDIPFFLKSHCVTFKRTCKFRYANMSVWLHHSAYMCYVSSIFEMQTVWM